MTDTQGEAPGHDDAHLADDCAHVLKRVYEFIDNELDSASGDTIREHLSACEPCLDKFDVEQAVKSLVARRCGGDTAPDHLRAKVLSQLTAGRAQA
ncbi:MAG TPA: mycothiol system anti-sigma-R factor [Propionibacteriaceae bacterium]|nr:mycothiol system anti-sigma-R factor [Propionibacteriaceae bacterium]